MGLSGDGTIFAGDSTDPSALLRLLSGRKVEALVASADTLHDLAEIAAQQAAPDLEHVIVRAPSQCDAALIRSRLAKQVSAFVALDETVDALLWIDDFNPGAPLTGRPAGAASVFVLDEWDKVAPIGVRGRLYKKTHADEDSEMAPLSWFGRWLSDGTLEINTRHFDTLELDAEELEELLR